MSLGASIALTLPELILSIGGIILMLAAAWKGDNGAEGITWISVVLLVVAALACGQTHGVGFEGLYTVDAFSTYTKILIFLAAACALLLSPRWFATEEKMRAEYPVLILFAAVGMGMMVSATNLLTLYMGIEMNSLASYVLAAFVRKDQRTAEAGLKYFVLGALASGILLYGISLLYGFSGSVDYAGVAAALKDGVNLGELFGIVFVLSGIAFKISAVPFHMWTPDVYEGAPTPVTAFFASAPKVAAMAMLARITSEAMGAALQQWQQILIFLSLASIILGAVGAIGQTNIKRLLAYSSINNVGFALVGLAAGGEQGVSATLSYLAVYVVTTLGAFACVMQMRDQNGRHVEEVDSLSGLSQTSKPLAAAFAILMFSLAGIPPLFGFWPKLLVFFSATSAGLFPLAVIAALGSVIGAYYYLRIVKIIYFDAPKSAFLPVQTYREAAIILVSSILLVVGYILIPVLGDLTANAAKALF